MLIADDIVINPKEMPMVPARTERSLSKMGFTVLGVQWGDSVTGDNATRTIIATLRVEADSEANLPTAAHELQQLIDAMQERETWIRRDHKVGGPFKGPIMYRVKATPDGKPPEVTLSNLGGWQAGSNPDVELTIVAQATGYATEEVVQAQLAAAAASYFAYEGTPSQGSDKGLRRIRYENKNSSGDLRGLLWSEECWDLSSAPTAAPVYEAIKLDRRGASGVAFNIEEPSVQWLKSTNLTSGWMTVLGTKIEGLGHMTHRGGRRVWMRVSDPGAISGNIQLKLVWRVLGSSRWVEENAIATVTAINDLWQWIDLDSVRPQVAALGSERWEGKVLARARNGSGRIKMQFFAPLSTEQYLMLQDTEEPPVDGEPTLYPKTVEDSGGVGTVAWSEPMNAAAVGGGLASAANTENTTRQTHYLKATNLGFAIPAGAIIYGISVSVRRRTDEATVAPVTDNRARVVKGGVVKEAVDRARSENWPKVGSGNPEVTYGSSTDLWGLPWTPEDINNSGFGFALSANLGVLNVGGVYFRSRAEVDSIQVIVAYTEGANENRVCFATRSVEIRSNGCYRQHPTEEVWGKLTPIGFSPYSPPGGLEGRPVRGILIPTQGDLEARPDVGTNKAAVTVYERAGHKIARESA